MTILWRMGRRPVAVASFGLLAAGGCLANFERNVDLVLGSNAFSNALVLPYSNLADLASFVARFL